MRKIIGVLAVLLICTAFVGAGAAFTISDTVKVDPSGILSPGDKVSAKVTIKIAPKSLEMDDYVTLSPCGALVHDIRLTTATISAAISILFFLIFYIV